MNDTDLAQRRTISAMIATYDTQLARVLGAMATIKDAEKILSATFSEKYNYFNAFNTIERGYGELPNLQKEVKLAFKKEAWKRIIARLDIDKLMSAKRKKDFDERMEKSENQPDITEAAVFDILSSLAMQVKEFSREMMLEAYDNLMPAQTHSGQMYKTNQKNGKDILRDKVILGWAIERDYSGGFRVRYGYYSENKLIVIDKAFHALDSKQISTDSYRSPLCDAINQSGPSGKGETEYFKFICYQNGNLHLTLKRDDLVKRLNQIAADGTKLRSAI